MQISADFDAGGGGASGGGGTSTGSITFSGDSSFASLNATVANGIVVNANAALVTTAGVRGVEVLASGIVLNAKDEPVNIENSNAREAMNLGLVESATFSLSDSKLDMMSTTTHTIAGRERAVRTNGDIGVRSRPSE